MGLLTLLPSSKLGFGGTKPLFYTGPVPPGSLHKTYSVDGNPSVFLISSNSKKVIPKPSRLDEWDATNTSKFRSAPGKRYMDNPPV
jgi:hypothetical protein